MKRSIRPYFKMRQPSVALLLVFLVALLTLTACGGNEPAAQSTPTPTPGLKQIDACKLVTADDMGMILGTQIQTTLKNGRAAGEIYCVYKDVNNPDDPHNPYPTLNVFTRDGEAAWNNVINGQTNSPDRYLNTDVDGTKAIFEKSLSRLWFQKKGYTLIATVYRTNSEGTGPDTDKGMDFTKQLAKIALQRL
jgi:hypothetical protein